MNRKQILPLVLAALSLASCGDQFLDVEPDNRATLNSEEKIISLLTSAYPRSNYIMTTEYMSDNMDDMGETFLNYERHHKQLFYWEDVTEVYEELPENIWGDTYLALASANAALAAIEELGGPTTEPLRQARAEALLCRAYGHFILVNLFAMNYDPATCEKEPGVTYMTAPEDTPNPKYGRLSVGECYRLIEQDILEALPMVGELNYTVPKYHFNTKAAYAFAAKFFLFYEKWDECIKYADLCLGANPGQMLRDWKAYNELSKDFYILTNNYADASHNCNLLLCTSWSLLGVIFGPFSNYKRFSHSRYLAYSEDIMVRMPWGAPSWWTEPLVFIGSNFNMTIFYRLPYLFEYTDPVAGIGYPHTVAPAFTADETLLIRAEAKILRTTPDYKGALDDLNLWFHNITNITAEEYTLSKESVVDFYNDMDYAQWDNSTPKKHLNAAFDTGEEGSDKEAMLQFILHLKRVESLQLGQRWFDIKRYGIEIWRRTMNSSGTPEELKDVLPPLDPRRAIQIPQKARDAGYEPNPR